MSKTSSAVKNRYAQKAYDRLHIIIPKGMKDKVNEYAKDNNTTINTMVNELLRKEVGIAEADWTRQASNDTATMV